MAFLAVLREGFETSVFLLAAFQDATDTTAAGAGAVIGLLAAVAIGLGLYRGGVRINLARFFRVTGLVLVFVAAGLLATSLHTAHEAGWFNALQGQALDLTWLVQPGTVSGSLLTGMLGLQPSRPSARPRSTFSTRCRWRSTCSGRTGCARGGRRLAAGARWAALLRARLGDPIRWPRNAGVGAGPGPASAGSPRTQVILLFQSVLLGCPELRPDEIEFRSPPQR